MKQAKALRARAACLVSIKAEKASVSGQKETGRRMNNLQKPTRTIKPFCVSPVVQIPRRNKAEWEIGTANLGLCFSKQGYGKWDDPHPHR